MKPEELRIGNYINSENGEGRITCIEETRVSVDNDKLPYTPLDYINPILLTGEWLIKFGFEKYDYDYKIGDFRIRNVRTLSGIQTDKFEYLPFAIVVKIEYVHQLQNLYFALINNDLKIKI